MLVGAGLGLLGAAGTAHLLDVDDDLLRAVGARPRPLPDAGDDRRLAAASAAQTALLAEMEEVGARHADLASVLEPLLEVARQQLRAVGGEGATTPPTVSDSAPDAVTAVARGFARSARDREGDAVTSVSPDLARVLASLAAGHAQLARRLGRAA